MSNRVSVRVTTSCGNTWVSTMNATFAEAQEYYMGRRFEIMVADKKAAFGCREVLQGPVVKVDLIA